MLKMTVEVANEETEKVNADIKVVVSTAVISVAVAT